MIPAVWFLSGFQFLPGFCVMVANFTKQQKVPRLNLEHKKAFLKKARPAFIKEGFYKRQYFIGTKSVCSNMQLLNALSISLINANNCHYRR